MKEITSLLNAREAASLLGIKLATLRKWTYERRIPCIRLGRRVLYNPEALKRIIRAGEQPALRPLNGQGQDKLPSPGKEGEDTKDRAA